MLYTSNSNFARGRRGRQAGSVSSISGECKRRLVLSALLLFGGLAGCSREVPGMAIDKDTKVYQYEHAAQIEPMKNAVPGVGSVVDATTGRPLALSAPAASVQLPTPVAVSSDVALDDPNGNYDSGEKAGSWVGALDIYWKLNWARQELLNGNVPRALPDVVARQRQHLTRIMRESKHLAPDPGHYIPSGVTIPDALAYADAALKHLDAGLAHIQQKSRLEAAGIRSLSIPWTASEDEVARQFERQGLIKTEHTTGVGEHDDEESSPSVARRSRPRQTEPLTRQDEAVALALQYARAYHASPEDMARHEFEGALRDIVRLRDLLHYEFHKPSVPGSDTMIPGTLHQEPGSPLPTGAPASIKDRSDPFRKLGDTSQAVDDPFRDGK